MRKIYSYILLFLLLLYQAGFYLIYLTERYRSGIDWQEKPENANNESLRKSIPITLPYQPDQGEFQPVLKVIEAEGKFYRVIKQKYAKDTLHIIYQPDKIRDHLHASLQEWVKSISQESPSAPDHRSPIRDGLEKNYLPAYNFIQPVLTIVRKSDFKFTFTGILLNNPLEIPEPPPKPTSSGA